MGAIDPTSPPPYTAAAAVAAVLAWLLSILTTAGDTIARNASSTLARVGIGPVAMSAFDIDFSAGEVQTKTITTGQTFTASNYTWARGGGVLLVITNSGTVAAPAWPGTTTFMGTWNTTAAAVNVVRLVWTGGTTFRAFVLAPGMSLTTAGSVAYASAAGVVAESKQGTSALAAYAIDWAAADRFTKTLAGGDTFTHSNTEAKIAIRLVLTVNGQAIPSGIGTAAPGTATWSSAWTTAWVIIMKDGAGGYEYTLTGA